ncbi:MAG TPA: hypothetical protein VF271_01070 [Rhodanobacteraceae bacterium]
MTGFFVPGNTSGNTRPNDQPPPAPLPTQHAWPIALPQPSKLNSLAPELAHAQSTRFNGNTTSCGFYSHFRRLPMKLTRTLIAVSVAAAMVLSLSACSNSGQGNQSPSTQTPAATPASAPAAVPTPSASTAMASSSSMAMGGQTAATNWFGGPIYNGAPNLAATAALIKAGGGAKDFSFAKALVSMLGEKTVNAEVAKLTQQYGKADVDGFIKGMDFAVHDAIKRATAAGVKLPEPPADLTGAALAKGLVQAGTTPDGTFWAGYMFDRAISHKLHNQVMADIDAGPGHAADSNTHKILNQAMYDVAQALGMKDVKLASFH